jgi:hypothetical protein
VLVSEKVGLEFDIPGIEQARDPRPAIAFRA